MTLVVADTSALVAAADRSERNHQRCAAAVREAEEGGILIPATVLVEVDYLLRGRLGIDVARAFLAAVQKGRYHLEPVDADLFARAVNLDRHFADMNIGIVDGTVAATAERHQARAILTLDDHYRVIAPSCSLLPA